MSVLPHAVHHVLARHLLVGIHFIPMYALPTIVACLTGKAQQEYLQQRTLQLQAAAAAQQEAVRPQKSFLQQHRTDAWSLAKHACVLTLALLGASTHLFQCAGPCAALPRG